MSEELGERIARVEESAKSAHKRLDKTEEDILLERKAKHDIYEKLHTHAGIIVGMESAVKGLVQSVDTWTLKTEKNTKIIDRASWVIVGGVAVGGVLLSGILYLLNQFLALI